ncbi:hypothetical protein EDB92DRAFT_1887860 [Lactarius akahatsu]|uniref:F-box domain-containing protein n=1 Tax=Lactarius akahatsu TaxID=416441 RepID=A0AAD4LDF3_9AGAM|nr:hypothetical protein EDB92DRAFT_1887860 [Lactarius akahatsu]
MSGPIRLPQLPVDILHAIVDELVVDFDSQNSDQWVRHQNRLRRIFYSKELLTLRLVCREFCHIVSPRIFRTLKLTHTLPSIRGFTAMLRSPWVAPCVQSVKYQYWDPEPYRYETPADEVQEARSARVEIRELLQHALSCLHELPSLHSLSIRFGDIAPLPAELDAIRDDLNVVLSALLVLGTKAPGALSAFSLSRLPPIHLPQYDDPAFRALLAGLDQLEIHTAGTDAWSALTTPPLPQDLISPCEPFFSRTLPRCLLPASTPAPPTAFAHLEALALSFSDPVGVFYLSYNFADLFFPALRALRLQHVQFSAARDAEHLVTRHANTLLELHIAHCQIAVPQNGTENPQAAVAAAFAAARNSINNSINGNPQPLPLPPPDDDAFDGWPVVPRPWSDIYTEFMNKLGRLVFLDVQDPWWLSFPDRYVTYSPSVVMQFLEDGREDDIRALEAFHRTVEERAKSLGIEYKPAIRIPDEDEFICDCH